MKSPSVERQDHPAIQQFLEFCRYRKIARRARVLAAAELKNRLFYLVEGSVEVLMAGEDGREIVLAYLHKGHFFGEMGLFDAQERQKVWVRARTDSEIADMSYERFEALVADEPELMFEVAAQLAKRLARVNARINDLAFVDLAGRVAHALLDLAAEPDAVQTPEGAEVFVSKAQLARVVGCTREAASRVVRDLQSRGLIKDMGKKILVRPSRNDGVGRRGPARSMTA